MADKNDSDQHGAEDTPAKREAAETDERHALEISFARRALLKSCWTVPVVIAVRPPRAYAQSPMHTDAVPPHTDTPHADTGTPHTDTPHADTLVHSDSFVPHTDELDEEAIASFGPHVDTAGHFDAGGHTDSFDMAGHSDSVDAEGHSDTCGETEGHSDAGGETEGHSDAGGHTDSMVHGDTGHSDTPPVPHTDTGHADAGPGRHADA